MSLFYTEAELSRLRAAAPDSRQRRLYEAMRARTLRNTRADAWVQPGDTQEWYHLCWERMADAAFVWAVEGGEALGQWIRARTLDTVRLDTDAWLGPWYRDRSGPEPVGALETAHITLAVCEAYENARGLFDEVELCQIRTALREKGMTLCERYARHIDDRRMVSNWHVVLLNGYGTAAAVLGDREAMADARRLSCITAQIYNADSYGESLQYANYASIAQSHLVETLLRAGETDLAMDCYTKLMPWFAASYLYQKELPSIGMAPRSVNFGDSAAAFRPSGDILAQVAARQKEAYPAEAALASWLLEVTYAEPEVGPDELATFGFFNQFGCLTVLLEPDMAPAQSPEALGMPLNARFDCGHIIARDRWEDPGAVLAIFAGYEPCNVTAHRHLDQNSFQLVVDGERMLIDPGHCCYRLHARRVSREELAHSMISIEAQTDEPYLNSSFSGHARFTLIPQASVDGTLYMPKAPKNRLLLNERVGNAQVVVSDAAGLYDERVTRAVRIWVYRLPDMIFVADVVEATVPVSLWSHFALNNRDNALDAHVYNDHRLVFRRHGRGIKLFEAASWADGTEVPSELVYDWGYVHDFYHPLPNQVCQGREGSSLIYNWRCPKYARSHQRIHTIAASDADTIRSYHVRTGEDGFVRIEGKDHADWLDLRLDAQGFTVRQPGHDDYTFTF